VHQVQEVNYWKTETRLGSLSIFQTALTLPHQYHCGNGERSHLRAILAPCDLFLVLTKNNLNTKRISISAQKLISWLVLGLPVYLVSPEHPTQDL